MPGLASPPRSRFVLGARRVVAPVAVVAMLVLAAVVPATGASASVGTAVAGLSRYVPVAPARVLDTRTGVGAPAVRPASGASVVLQVTGRGGVPASGVSAVTLNVVVTDPRQLGYVQVLPFGGGTLGGSSNINVYYLGQTAGNLVTVPVGANGAVTLYDVAGGNLIADVLGYFATAATSTDGRYVALNPTRILDTRDGTGTGGSAPFSKPTGGTALGVQLTGAGGIPASGVSSVAMTLTATQSSGPGFVQVVPTGGPTALGSTSNVNLTGAGQTVANLVVVPVGTGGSVQVYNSSGTHLIVDVVGYFTDSTAPSSALGLFVPVSPARLMDTRASGPATAGSTTALAPLGAAGIPADAVSAVFVNPTATGTTGPGFLQLYPAGRGVPGASSSLNFTGPGQTIANASIAALGDLGVVDIFTPTGTQVIVDVFGYFTGTPAGPAKYTAYAWGTNESGQLGDGTTTYRTIPGQVGADTHWAQVAAGGGEMGYEHTVAVKTNGTLWAWGNNADGELGDGTTTDRSVPVQVGTDAHWAQVAAGFFYTVAVKTDGTLWAWGFNSDGELGDGTTASRLVPVQVGTDTNWASVAAGTGDLGHATTAAVKTDGTLWAWGSNFAGKLGDGTTTNRRVPVQVGTDTHWTQVAAGSYHTVALKTDGTLWAWGWNPSGALGDGTTIDRSTPVQVGTDTHWAQVSASWDFTVAVKTDGTLWAWGYNGDGELGDGTTTDRSIPVQIGMGADWAQVAAGGYYTAAVTTGGTLWAWGWNGAGNLGDGTTTDRLAPVRVGTGTHWSQVSAGWAHTVGLRS